MARTYGVLVGSALVLMALASSAASADDFEKLPFSAKLVPDDAAFYSTSLRNREQVETVLNSKAWAKLMELPAVQELRKKVVEQLDQPLGPLNSPRELLKDPENQELIKLLADMGGTEIFVYGGSSAAAFLELAAQVNGGMQFQNIFNQFQGLGRANDPSAAAKALIQALAESEDLIQTPDLVIGFRVSDVKRATAQLARLEKHVSPLVDQIPELKGRLKRSIVGDVSYLTLELDGTMVPWDQMPLKEIEENPGDFDDLIKKLKELKLTVSLGVNGDYVLLGIGESAAHLAQFTASGKRLASRPEFKPLAAHAARRINSINYVSQDLQTRLAMSDEDVSQLVEFAKSMLGEAELTEDQQKRLTQDLERFAEVVRKYLPKPGASMAFSFLTETGQESYAYDWSVNQTRDASKPLTLLEHVGGTPFMAAVNRSKYSPEDYQLMVKWIKVFHRYFEEFAVPRMEAEQQTAYDKFMKGAGPLFRRLDEATAKYLLPALADGQAGLVVDGKLTSTQWVTMLPPTESPLPMLELAVVFGVSDGAKLRRAVAEYWDVAKKMIVIVREIGGEDVPEFELPEPQIKKDTDGELFSFPLPLMIPLDKKLTPTAGLSDKVAVLTMSNDHAQRLLKSTPLTVSGGVLGDSSRKLAAATVVDWAATIDAITPWVDIGVRMAAPLADPVVGDVADLPAQVHTVLEILKVFRNYSSATYQEGNAWVTHGRTVLKDLP